MKLLLIGLALLAAACAPSAPAALGDRPALDPDDVVVYASEEDVPGEFEVVEVIVPPADIARTGSGYGGTGAVERYARRRAAALGANGVLVVGTAETGTRTRAVSAVVNGYSLAPGNLVAIHVAGADG